MMYSNADKCSVLSAGKHSSFTTYNLGNTVLVSYRSPKGIWVCEVWSLSQESLNYRQEKIRIEPSFITKKHQWLDHRCTSIRVPDADWTPPWWCYLILTPWLQNIYKLHRNENKDQRAYKLAIQRNIKLKLHLEGRGLEGNIAQVYKWIKWSTKDDWDDLLMLKTQVRTRNNHFKSENSRFRKETGKLWWRKG